MQLRSWQLHDSNNLNHRPVCQRESGKKKSAKKGLCEFQIYLKNWSQKPFLKICLNLARYDYGAIHALEHCYKQQSNQSEISGT